MKSTQFFNKNKKGLECLNCGQPLFYGDNFCSNCGQVNDELPLSIKQFISEFFAGFFSFDTRFFKTIVPLLFKPGKVSKEYIHGKRRKYTNPFQLYLHTSIVFFLLMGLNSTINNFKKYNRLNTLDSKEKDYTSLKDSARIILDKEVFLNYSITYSSESDKLKKLLDSLYLNTDFFIQLQDTTKTAAHRDSLFDNLHEMGMQIAIPDYKRKQTNVGLNELDKLEKISEQMPKTAKLIQKYFTKKDINYTIDTSYFESLGQSIKDNFATENTSSNLGRMSNFFDKHKDIPPVDALDSLHIEKTKKNLFLYQKVKDVHKLIDDKDYRKSYGNSVVSKISIALFFLLPFFTLFFSLLYVRHTFIYTEHLVVVFNLQTVFLLLFITGSLLDKIVKTDFFSPVFQFLFLFYFYKTLRNFYQQRRFKTIIKFLFLNFTYIFLALIGLLVISFLAFVI